MQIVPIFLSAHSVASALNLVMDRIFLNSKVDPKIIFPLDKFWTQVVYTSHTMQCKCTWLSIVVFLVPLLTRDQTGAMLRILLRPFVAGANA